MALPGLVTHGSTDECIGVVGNVPVMRCTTLKAAGGRVEGLLAYYAGLAEDRVRPCRNGRGPVDYYLDPDEPAGRWWGSGRHALGLGGEVEGEELRALLEGRHPGTGAKLGRGFGASSARGFDATFSAPKSVSVLWALTPDAWVRAEVLAAHDTAVDAALGWLERHGAVTRRGTNGVHQVDTNGIVAALFRQHTSRTVDPQLHTHAVIAAKVQDPTGKWLSLDARFLKGQQHTIGWIYDAALRAELTTRLGVGWVWDEKEDRPVDLAVIPDELRTVFSERSAQVDTKLTELIDRWRQENDGEDPDQRTISELERRAVVASRPGKTHGTDAGTLHDEWADQARAAGFDRAALDRRHLQSVDPTGTQPSDEVLIAEALRRAEGESACWLGADVARHLSNLVPTDAGRSAGAVVAEIDRLSHLAIDRCVALGPDQHGPTRRDGRPISEPVTARLFTTTEALDQEIRLQVWAEASAARFDRRLDPQSAAVDAITGHAPLVVIVGPAGTGKTTTTARAVQALGVQGRSVVGLAPSGKAADVLATEAGIPTDTVAGFLTRHRTGTSRWPAGTTVILDEAGMTATDDLAHLVDLVRHHRWRLVAVGDPAQLPAVGRGGVFAHWCNTVPHIELATPRRFRQPWEAEASLLLRAGDPAAAELYAANRRLRTAHPAVLAHDVARLYRRHADAGRTVAITTNTAETARAINTAIQRSASTRRSSPSVQLADGTTARVGDQIATRRNEPSLRTNRGEQVRNRHTWTVTAVDPGGALALTHPERGEVRLPARYVANHVEFGWAVTGYGNQGDTVDTAIAVLEPGTTRRHAYVAMTRGRHTNLALIPDPTGTTDPAQTLTDMISRTPNHDSALATRTRLHEEAGILEPPLPANGPIDSDRAAKADEIQRRLDALQRRPGGHSLGL
jgi:conjugative relaxase-like TrwC/TraI family protein